LRAQVKFNKIIIKSCYNGDAGKFIDSTSKYCV